MLIEINECASQPCFNNGTCTDLVDGYECHCYYGTLGQYCETSNMWNIVKWNTKLYVKQAMYEIKNYAKQVT